jgi:hypothetical protein
MAAPAIPQSQAIQPGAPGTTQSVPPSPISAETQAREKERVTVLLEINHELLQEVINLQEQGKGGFMGPQPPPGPNGEKPPEMKQASKEYVEYVLQIKHVGFACISSAKFSIVFFAAFKLIFLTLQQQQSGPISPIRPYRRVQQS